RHAAHRRDRRRCRSIAARHGESFAAGSRSASAESAASGEATQNLIDLSTITSLSQQLSARYLEYAGVLPVDICNGVVRVATWRESIDDQVIDDLRVLFDADIDIHQCDESELRSTIQRVYARDYTAQDVIDAASAGAATACETGAIDDLVTMA